MMCPFPPGGFPSGEVSLLSVFNDLSRGLRSFSVAVIDAAALAVLPASAVVSSPRLLRRIAVGIGMIAFCCPRAVRAPPGQVSVEGQRRDPSKKNLKSPPVSGATASGDFWR